MYGVLGVYLIVFNNIEQSNDVGFISKVLQNFDFMFDFFFFDWFQNFDDVFLIVDDVDVFEDF